jgi:hypothetical protein
MATSIHGRVIISPQQPDSCRRYPVWRAAQSRDDSIEHRGTRGGDARSKRSLILEGLRSGGDGLSGRQRELEDLIVELGRHAEAVATSQPCAT